jgi:hypothetical protein
MFGTQGPDEMRGEDGNDWIRAWGITDDATNPDPSVAKHLTDGDDVVFGGRGSDKLEGGGGHDWMYGDDSDDVVGASANDTLIGGVGTDNLIGRDGSDVFSFGWVDGPQSASEAYVGTAADVIWDYERGIDQLDLSRFQNPNDPGYAFFGTGDLQPTSKLGVHWRWEGTSATLVEWAANTWAPGTTGQFMGANGAIRLVGMHDLSTADFGVPLTGGPQQKFFASEQQAQAVRMYDTTFDRKADPGGLDYWTKVLESGIPLKAVAGGFMQVEEWQSEYGTPDNTQFVNLLYQNVLDRPGEPGGMAFWTNVLNRAAADRADIVVGFSESHEHVVRTTATDYLP